ncbi:MAG TPA: S8 family serine peptidase [Longimicrobium sp.]|nr:S8 family serine peptidase [Longimicrobium sp.]
MGKIDVLVEVAQRQPQSFALFAAALDSEIEAVRQGEALVPDLAGLGLEVVADFAPVPMFALRDEAEAENRVALAAFASPDENPDLHSTSVVVPCQVERSRLEELRGRAGVRVYPNSPLALFCDCGRGGAATLEADSVRAPYSRGTPDAADWAAAGMHPFDLASSASGVDCRPFQAAVSIDVIRTLLGVERVWFDGFRGQNVVVGIIDEGVNGEAYPVVGGFVRPNNPRPGSAAVTSHGSMCAADILVAAPAAKLYDYPFLGQPNSGGAMAMFNEVLDQRRKDGTPHVTNNSYGFVGRPPRADFPNHEVYDIDHPLHRKVREVVASGCATFFAAGNCGGDCPSSRCHPSGTGPRLSINGSNALDEVITVAAVNRHNDRIGYSSQGPGPSDDGFAERKPDIAAYSHFFGNFGPGRPAGGDTSRFDNGTSASTPVAAGVAALLLSAIPGLAPNELKDALIGAAVNVGAPGWDPDTGHGVINAAASYLLLRGRT